ncbi:MAG: di-heme oxidoredictase family protein [Isosphaerales bacterium]
MFRPVGTPGPGASNSESFSSTLQLTVEADLSALRAKRNTLGSLNGAPVATKGRNVDESGDAGAAIRIQQIQALLFANNTSLRNTSVAVGEFLVTQSQRNPTPLFGLGLIDAIPDDAIEAMAKRQAKESPEIQGRVSHVKDGRIGRLGWKGQVANVEDFVLNACAVELGLEVPGHHQAMIPQAPKYRASGLDLTSEECAALVAYVRSLPKPVERPASGVEEAKLHDAGKATFASIGCAGCHSPRLGNVQGIYADLLLHDMGQEMSDDGSYDDSGSSGDDEPLVPRIAVNVADGRPSQPTAPQAPRGATRREWRTPPLWGFRDSGPYLHDGRAQTLEQAVAMHGGQGAASAHKFFGLSPRERLQVEALLKSLVAPPTGQLASR